MCVNERRQLSMEKIVTLWKKRAQSWCCTYRNNFKNRIVILNSLILVLVFCVVTWISSCSCLKNLQPSRTSGGQKRWYTLRFIQKAYFGEIFGPIPHYSPKLNYIFYPQNFPIFFLKNKSYVFYNGCFSYIFRSHPPLFLVHPLFLTQIF